MFRERESNKYETNVLQTNRPLPVLLYFEEKKPILILETRTF